MFLTTDGSHGSAPRLVLSASDLRTAARCEFALVRELDVVLGRADPVEPEADPMLARVAALGDEHEQAELRRLVRAHAGRVVQFPRPGYAVDELADAHRRTVEALRSDAELVYQATLFDGGFVGHADFLERTDAGWLVSDTKLARTESVTALLQVAAYASLLRSTGVPTAPAARLVVGTGDARDFPLDDLLPVYLARRLRLEALLTEHRAASTPAAWGDPRWLACGRCEVCDEAVVASRDLLLVAGMRGPTRRALLDAGVATVDDLATRAEPVPDVREARLARLREQARLQLEQERDPEGGVRAEVVDPAVLRRMPDPSPGDVFFDFEGDPLWAEPGSSTWGLEYLFGVVEVDTGDPEFRAFWAHDRDAERAALVDFVAWLRARRERWPDLHVYHYAPYEPSALLRLAARHGVCEDDVDQLLREGVFVDLYARVRAGVRVSQRSYSIKRLEPLYMPAREGAVVDAAQSVVAYHEFLAATAAGRRDAARQRLEEIADYNRDDCESTWRLRDWLLGLVDRSVPAEAPADPPPVAGASDQRLELMRLEATLRGRVDGVAAHQRTPEQQAVAMVAASVLFHAREDKPVWQEHFERLRLPVGEWRGADGVYLVEHAEVVEPWHTPPRARKPRRHLRMVGEPLRGVALPIGGKVSAVYADPPPAGITTLPGHANACSSAGCVVLESEEQVAPNGRLRQVLLVEELAPSAGCEHDEPPAALVPSDFVSSSVIDAALAEVARSVIDSPDALPRTAGTDVLVRREPRLRDGGPLPAVGGGGARHRDAITAALLAMDDSYVAVQGPPGTGKTFVGAGVIARLVLDHGWRVGVTSQGHAAIENLLRAVVAAGVPAEQVGKAAKSGGPGAAGAGAAGGGAAGGGAAGAGDGGPVTWTRLARADELAGFAAVHERAGVGYVVGGTAWDLTHPRRVGRGQLDLVVIDEAGQFSLPKTLACSVAGSRLLLLGDPQQLPQVSRGIHPEPVDASALGWLLGDEAVLPPHLGYFLEETWRMHPALTEVVSHLSYAGRLGSHEAVTTARTLAGVEPGLHVRLVDHHDNSTWSVEEADAVVALVRGLLGREWHDPQEKDAGGRPLGPRPLRPSDVLVVTPYNAQQGALRSALDAAGLREVRAGTVDKFQGQQAPVVVVSMAASSHSDVSRGMGFLLDRHRLNVAVSRGQHSAFLVRSAVLTDFPPRSPAELLALGGFLGVGDRAVSTQAVDPPGAAAPLGGHPLGGARAGGQALGGRCPGGQRADAAAAPAPAPAGSTDLGRLVEELQVEAAAPVGRAHPGRLSAGRSVERTPVG
jgi:uncharacterized protein